MAIGQPTSNRLEASDEELAHRCRSELPYVTAAFEALLTRYELQVFQTCRHYLRNEADAEEVTQDVFLRVFRAVDRFAEKASFRTWLFRIVHNECATRYGKLKRRAEGRRAYVQERLSEPPAQQAEIEPSPLSDRVEAALAALPADDRQVLVLRFVTDLSLKEIARALGIKLSAAKMRLYRAQDRFREEYEWPGSERGGQTEL